MPQAAGRGRSARIVAVAAAAGVVASVIAVLLVPMDQLVLDGRSYQYETESLFGNRSFLTYQYRGVTFTFHLWCGIAADTGYVCGNATEPGGATFAYSFGDGIPPAFGPPPWQTWIAPTGHEAVQYQDGGHVRLLVAT